MYLLPTEMFCLDEREKLLKKIDKKVLCQQLLAVSSWGKVSFRGGAPVS